MLGVLVGKHGDVIEVELVLEGIKSIQFHQIVGEVRAVNQADWDVEKLIAGKLFQNSQDRCKSSSAGEQQDRADRFTQEEGTHRAGQGELVADLRVIGEIGGHESTWGYLDQELHVAGILSAGERVGTSLVAAWNLDVHVLTREERQILAVFQFDLNADGGIREVIDLLQLAIESGCAGLCQHGGGGDLQDEVGLWGHLARQAVAVGCFIFGQASSM